MIRLSGEFPARLGAYREIEALLQDFAARARLQRDDGLRLNLIVEELFTNTVRHGHGGDSDATVSLTLETAGASVALVYQDSARPYNPLSAAYRADTASPLEQRPVGGLGMLLTVSLCRDARYSYVEGRNRVELTLPRTRAGDP